MLDAAHHLLPEIEQVLIKPSTMMPSKVDSGADDETDIAIQPYDRSEPPTYVTGKDGKPSHFTIPSESGYFPAASDDVRAIATADNVTRITECLIAEVTGRRVSAVVEAWPP